MLASDGGIARVWPLQHIAAPSAMRHRIRALRAVHCATRPGAHRPYIQRVSPWSSQSLIAAIYPNRYIPRATLEKITPRRPADEWIQDRFGVRAQQRQCLPRPRLRTPPRRTRQGEAPRATRWLGGGGG